MQKKILELGLIASLLPTSVAGQVVSPSSTPNPTTPKEDISSLITEREFPYDPHPLQISDRNSVFISIDFMPSTESPTGAVIRITNQQDKQFIEPIIVDLTPKGIERNRAKIDRVAYNNKGFDFLRYFTKNLTQLVRDHAFLKDDVFTFLNEKDVKLGYIKPEEINTIRGLSQGAAFAYENYLLGGDFSDPNYLQSQEYKRMADHPYFEEFKQVMDTRYTLSQHLLKYVLTEYAVPFIQHEAENIRHNKPTINDINVAAGKKKLAMLKNELDALEKANNPDERLIIEQKAQITKVKLAITEGELDNEGKAIQRCTKLVIDAVNDVLSTQFHDTHGIMINAKNAEKERARNIPGATIQRYHFTPQHTPEKPKDTTIHPQKRRSGIHNPETPDKTHLSSVLQSRSLTNERKL